MCARVAGPRRDVSWPPRPRLCFPARNRPEQPNKTENKKKVNKTSSTKQRHPQPSAQPSLFQNLSQKKIKGEKRGSPLNTMRRRTKSHEKTTVSAGSLAPRFRVPENLDGGLGGKKETRKRKNRNSTKTTKRIKQVGE